MMTFAKMAEINAANGFYFFARDTMRFFRTRLCGRVFYGKVLGEYFFVTSDRSPYSGRKYTVRKFDATTGNVKTVGEFQAYGSREVALRAAKRACGFDSSVNCEA